MARADPLASRPLFERSALSLRLAPLHPTLAPRASTPAPTLGRHAGPFVLRPTSVRTARPCVEGAPTSLHRPMHPYIARQLVQDRHARLRGEAVVVAPWRRSFRDRLRGTVTAA